MVFFLTLLDIHLPMYFVGTVFNYLTVKLKSLCCLFPVGLATVVKTSLSPSCCLSLSLTHTHKHTMLWKWCYVTDVLRNRTGHIWSHLQLATKLTILLCKAWPDLKCAHAPLAHTDSSIMFYTYSYTWLIWYLMSVICKIRRERQKEFMLEPVADISVSAYMYKPILFLQTIIQKKCIVSVLWCNLRQ